MTDQHDSDRVPMLGQVGGEIMVYEPMTVTNLSVTGVAVETRYPLHLDSLHDMRLTLGNLPVVVKARVVHSHISDIDPDLVTYHSGMQFVELPDHVRTAIRQFLDAVKAHRAGV
jgi:PilZ domain-containing protein